MAASCLNCSRYLPDGSNIVPPFIVKGAPILIIGDAPTKYELQTKTVFTDKMNLTLKMFLNDIININNLSSIKISYMNILQCHSENKLTAHDVKMCSSKLEEAIAEANPKLIIALGMNVANALLVEGSKLKDIRGATINKYIGGANRSVLVTFSMEAIMKSPGKIQAFKNNLANALKIIHANTRDIPIKVTSYTETADILNVLDEGIDYINNKHEETGKKVLVALDTETSGNKPYIPSTRVIAVSLCWDASRGGIGFSTNHKDAPKTTEELSQIYNKLNLLINSDKVALTLANGKYDYGFLLKEGVPPISPTWDIILGEHLLDEDKKGEYSLKVISTDYFPSLEKYADELKQEEARLAAIYAEKMKADSDEAQSARYKYIFQEFISTPEDVQHRLLEELEGVDYKLLSTNQRNILYNWVHFKQKFDVVSSSWSCVLPDKSKKKITMTILLSILLKLIQIPRISPTYFPKSFDKYINPEDYKLLPLLDLTKYEKDFELYSLNVLLKYAAMDALATYLVTLEQVKRFREDDKKVFNITSKEVMEGEIPSLFYTMNKLSMPLSRELSDIEYQGITLDRQRIPEIIDSLKTKYNELRESIYKVVSPDINIFSSKQLSDYLFNTLNLTPVNYTDKGEPSVDEESLDNLAEQYGIPILNDIISLKKISKAVKTYLNNWYNMSKWDNKLHAAFNIIGTATGRLSSSNPNLQNVPAYLAGVNMKSVFIPDSDDYYFVDCDINNAEMRVLCAYSKEQNLILAFKHNKDQHSITAEILSDYEISYDRLNAMKDDKASEEYLWRQIGKKTNFGVIFCISPMGLAKQAPIDKLVMKELDKMFTTQEEKDKYLSTVSYQLSKKSPPIYGLEAATYRKAEQVINTFLNGNPGVKQYINRTQYYVETYGCTLTLTGRRRRFELSKYDKGSLFKAKRQAVNARIQGTSSDIVTNNLVCINKVLRHLGIGRVLITVHDSICFQVKKEYIDLVKPMLDLLVVDWVKEMFPWLPVDWSYGAEYGPNYGEAHNKLPNTEKDFFTLCKEHGIVFSKEDLVALLKN